MRTYRYTYVNGNGVTITGLVEAKCMYDAYTLAQEEGNKDNILEGTLKVRSVNPENTYNIDLPDKGMLITVSILLLALAGWFLFGVYLAAKHLVN